MVKPSAGEHWSHAGASIRVSIRWGAGSGICAAGGENIAQMQRYDTLVAYALGTQLGLMTNSRTLSI